MSHRRASRRVRAKAPSNIALIKYMGKVELSQALKLARNTPCNPSLSLTLSGLNSLCEIELADTGSDAHSIDFDPASSSAFSELERNRLRDHISRVRALFHESLMSVPRPFSWSVRTSNSFPKGVGIASSASAFAAATLASCAAAAIEAGLSKPEFAAKWEQNRWVWARWSREGSGSSCRSFGGPFVFWGEDNAVGPLPSVLPELTDFVVVLSRDPKEVSSSEAHRRVKSSPLWHSTHALTRPERARERAERLRSLLGSSSAYAEIAALAFEEMIDMHELFHTSQPSFRYMLPATEQLLEWSNHEWRGRVIPTLDAGPNPHFIVPTAWAPAFRQSLRKALSELSVSKGGSIEILEDREGAGPEWEME